jgi:hypothetical protein
MKQCNNCGSNNTEDLGYEGTSKRVQCIDCTKLTFVPDDTNVINQIEIALRDGLIEELTETTVTSVDLISRLTKLVKQQEESITKWEQQNQALSKVCWDAVEQRDRARAIAVRLEAECHRCNDTVHHGNEEQY